LPSDCRRSVVRSPVGSGPRQKNVTPVVFLVNVYHSRARAGMVSGLRCEYNVTAWVGNHVT